jgi:hypothetical protein
MEYVRTLLRRGSEHKDFCEDNYLTMEKDNQIFMIAFDGCSSGKESHFASALFSKLFRKLINETYLISDLEALSKALFRRFYNELTVLKGNLDLGIEEILSTILFSVYNIKNKELFLVISGDGAYCINENITKIEAEHNAPDYISYYLSSSFDIFWSSLKKEIFTDVKDFSLISDGIFSFQMNNKGLNRPVTDKEQDVIKDSLLVDKYLKSNTAMLARKINILKGKFTEELSHYDDLTIVRLIID